MIYLDNHATTACDPQVIESMAPYYADYFGNASSNHEFGELATEAVKNAIRQINALINGSFGELIFTSGTTESNNIVLLGAAFHHFRQTGKKGKIVTTQIEHKAVLAPLSYLANEGWEVEFLPIDSTGSVNINAAKHIIDNNTLLVSVQIANSEIGTIQPVKELAAIAHAAGALFHTDAAQAVGKIPFDALYSGIDFLAFNAHKIYGPKGIGCLWIKPGYQKFIQPITYGGDSGNHLRPGTLPVQLIVGFGAAAELCLHEFDTGSVQLMTLRDHFEEALKNRIPQIIINGDLVSRLPNNSNITFPGVEADMLLSNVPEIIASTGAACESGSIEPSRVLLAIGKSRESAYHTLRIGCGRFNTLKDVETAANVLADKYLELITILKEL